MKQLYFALSLLFIIPGQLIGNGKHCRRHCPRRMLCQPAPARPVVVAPSQPVVPIFEPVQQVAAQAVQVPVALPEPELIPTPITELPTRMPLTRFEQLKDYMTYLPHAVAAVIAGLLGVGLIKRYRARGVNPQPVAPVNPPPVAPQAPVAPQVPVVPLVPVVPPVPVAPPVSPVGPQGPVAPQVPVNNPVVQPLVPGGSAVGPMGPIVSLPQQPKEPVSPSAEGDVKAGADQQPVVPVNLDQSEGERDGKLASQLGYQAGEPIDAGSRPESVSPRVEVAQPDGPVLVPIPVAVSFDQSDAVPAREGNQPLAPKRNDVVHNDELHYGNRCMERFTAHRG